jgi:hypothetical protein
MNRLINILGAGLVGLALSGGAWAAGDTGVTAGQIEAAQAPADHETIARAFDDEAMRLDGKAKEHERMANTYRSAASKKGPDTAAMRAHCLKLAKQYSDAAEENRALAAAHRAMAKDCCKAH